MNRPFDETRYFGSIRRTWFCAAAVLERFRFWSTPTYRLDSVTTEHPALAALELIDTIYRSAY